MLLGRGTVNTRRLPAALGGSRPTRTVQHISKSLTQPATRSGSKTLKLSSSRRQESIAFDQRCLPARCLAQGSEEVWGNAGPVEDASEARTVSGQQASTYSPEPFPYDIADTEEKKILRQKTKILMEIITAGQDVESAIAKYSNEIDEQMLDILEQRSRLAARMKEDERALGGLALLKRRLAGEIERNKATPSQRLLDEMLGLLAPMEGVHPQEQEEEVERLLMYAFQPPPTPHVDIFATAARIAAGEEVESLLPEQQGHVPQHLFVWETEKILLEAAKNTRDLERTLRQGKMGKYEPAYMHALEVRREGLNHLKTILDIARKI